MKWYFAYGENHDVVSHILPEELLLPVIDDLHRRGIVDISYSLIKESEGPTHFDLPGMVMTDRHMHTVTFDGLSLSIPSTDIEVILLSLPKIRNRPEIAESCYKMHGHYRCICLTEKQKKLFSSALEKILPEARAITEAENKIFNERLANANKHNLLIKPRPVKITNKG
ncbi:MAG: hypothetical protein HXY23_14050 [Parvularculaceae bacterium]|nr:hypothetical protein [Parvularculaceae bacterium]